MRARVARCLGDERSVAMAVATYYQDNEDMPVRLYPSIGIGVRGAYPDPVMLTTPVSYISEVPIDPFTEYSHTYGKNSEYVYWFYSYRFVPGPHREKWYWACYNRGSKTNWYPNTIQKWSPRAVVMVYSYGPDGHCSGANDSAFASDDLWKKWQSVGANYTNYSMVYNASNGTLSNGMVMIFE